MAISVVGTQATQATANPTVTANLPAGLQENDLVFALFNNPNGVNPTLSEDSGTWVKYVELYTDDTSDTNLGLWYKFMGSTPDTTISITQSAGNNASEVATIAFRGVDLDLPDDGLGATTASGTNNASPNPPSVTPISNDTMIVVFVASSEGDDITNAPSGYTLQIDVVNTGANSACAIATKQLTGGAGVSEDPGTFTDYSGSSADSWAAVTVALRPASSGHSQGIGVATETDTAIALGRSKTLSISVAVETDEALALGFPNEPFVVDVAVETDTALALGRSKSLSLSVASESDTALALGRSKSLTIGVATETDTAVGLILGLPIGAAVETDVAIALGTRSKRFAIRTATEADFAVKLILPVIPRADITTDQLIRPYTPKPLPTIGKQLDPVTRHLLDELKRAQATINQLVQAAPTVADTEPDSPRRGMVRYAIAPWDPLGTGYSGYVVYNGSAWAAL